MWIWMAEGWKRRFLYIMYNGPFPGVAEERLYIRGIGIYKRI
jgi:hypothetical protein